MRLPREAYPFRDACSTYLPALRPAQCGGFAWWVYGTILAGSGCQAAVATAPEPVVGAAHTGAARQALREWLCDGADKAVPCAGEVAVTACFAPQRRWVLAWWRGEDPAQPLPLDATCLRDRLAVLSVSVLYRGGAIPVARHVTAANRPGAWLDPALALLDDVAPAVGPEQMVLVLADRGPWSPRLRDAIRGHGRHPLLRVHQEAAFRPTGGGRVRAATLAPEPGTAWVGAGTAFTHAPERLDATLVAVREEGQDDPCLVLTDVPTDAVGACWCDLRAWIELGFRALESPGWHWERTRRTDPDRVARHWLVLAVATLWTLATGTRVEDAARLGRESANLRVAVPPPAAAPRTTSVFARGLARLRWQLLRVRRLWARTWRWPEPWPADPPGLLVQTSASSGP